MGISTMNVVPLPTSLINLILPCIILTSCFEMDKPRPVPVVRRVGEPSTWTNGSKILACDSGGIPAPESEISTDKKLPAEMQ